jgi:hypothetical protein
MTENRDELLPCPFCGSDAERYPDGDMEGYSVMCSGRFQGIFNSDSNACPLAGHAFYKTQADANASWNRRAARSLTDGGQDAVQIFGPVKQAQDGTLYRTGQATGTVAPEQSGAGEAEVDELNGLFNHALNASSWAECKRRIVEGLGPAVRNLRSQLDSVRKERDELQRGLAGTGVIVGDLIKRAEAAEQRARDIREDAERYRWLRDNRLTGRQAINFAMAMGWEPAYRTASETDAAIDKARAQAIRSGE